MSGETDSAVEPLIRLVVKAVLMLLGLLIVRILVTVFPGLGNTVPSTELTVAQVVSAVIGILMTGVVGWVGLRVHSVSKSTDSRVVQDVARGARLIIFLFMILLLHAVLKPIVTPGLTPQPGVWTFDLMFLIIASVPLGLLCYQVVTNLDTLTDSVLDSLSGLSGVRGADKSATNTDNSGTGSDKTTICDDCGTEVPADGGFCPACGVQL